MTDPAAAAPREPGAPLLSARGLSKDYPRQRVDAPVWARLLGRLWGWTGRLDQWGALHEGLPVLRAVDLDVRQGETLAIVGPSGAGKSTLLHLLGALDAPSAGTVLYRGRDVTGMRGAELARWRNRTIGYIFQFYHLFPDLTALENVLLPAMVAHSVPEFLAARASLEAHAEALLGRVGLSDRAHHHPSELSGGEQQRVAIARALLLEPELLLCDEPTGNLDRRTGETILSLLWELKGAQTYVMVTHDERLAERADRIVRMVDGRIESDERRAPAQATPPPAPAPAPAAQAPGS